MSVDDNGVVTLNIYNKPPQISSQTQVNNINQTGQNLNTDRPQMYPKLNENIGNGSTQNQLTDPRISDNKRTQNMQGSIEEESETTDNNQNNASVMPAPPRYIQIQQPYYQQIPQPIVVGTPTGIPYNMGYGQPVVMQNMQNNPNVQNYQNVQNRNRQNYQNIQNNARNRPVNNAPRTIIIREQKKDHSTEDCCEGCLAGAASFLACCCLMGLCCGPHYGPHYGPRHRW